MKPAPKPALPPRGVAVLEEDLEHTGDLLDLLHALNDSHAGVSQLDELIARIPVLAARVLARAPKTVREDGDVGRALVLVGNKGLEGILFQLLEDLTVFKSELMDKK